MRITAFFLTALFVQVSARTVSQTITFSGDRVLLTTIFAVIKQQTGYVVVYNKSDLRTMAPVSIQAENESIDHFLDMVLKDQPLAYTIEARTISVKRKTDRPGIVHQISSDKAPPIKGRVIGNDGSPLVGATVKIKGKSISTVTDAKGEYSINANEGDALIISYVGFDTKEIKAGSSTATIVLNLTSNILDEAQIIAYGKTSKRFSTGNTGTVKAVDIAKQPVNNPLLALQGRVPGLVITQNSGVSGAGIAVSIQGYNSISKGNDPFYVIDGVPFTSQLLPNQGNILGSSSRPGGQFGAQNGNPLSLINPADIESIDILKDADATAIYGSRAANGAILITTKKGKAGKTVFDVIAQQGFGKVSNFLDLMNTKQYLAMRREAFINDGLAIPTSNVPANQKNTRNYDLTLWDTTRYTDWQKELIGGTASYSDVQASLSGGNSQTNFRINGGYHRETTVFPGSFSDVKGSFSINLNHTSANKRLSVSVTANYLADNNQLPGVDFTGAAITLVPLAPALYYPDGSLNWERLQTNPVTRDSVSTWVNPLAALNVTYQNKANNLTSNLALSYQIAKGLQFRTSLGYTQQDQRDYILNPLSQYAPEIRSSRSRSSNFSINSINSWIAEPQLIYNLIIGGGKMEMLVGSTFQENKSNGVTILASGYTSDQLMGDIRSASSVTISNTITNTYKYGALFGRLNYSLQDKYIVNLTGRRDGSSRFGSNNQFHDFGAIGAAWLFSNESFFNGITSIISFGKLRGSYGITGSDQIGDYGFLSLYNATGVAFPYQGAGGLLPTKHDNPDLQWEETKKLQAGLDLGFLHDKLLFNFTYYNNRSSNQLISYQLASTAGFQSVEQNFPATVENSGWEMALSTNTINLGSVKWSASANLTIPINKLISFPGLVSSSYNKTLVIGKPVDVLKLYTSAGVNTLTGNYQFILENRDTADAPNNVIDDRNSLISYRPTWYGGIQNSLTYQSFSLDFLFQFVKQIGSDYRMGNSSGPGFFVSNTSSGGNQPIWVEGRWQKPGDEGSVSKYGTGFNISYINAKQSDESIANASFIRLKNVSLSWNLPVKWAKNAHLQHAKLFIQGQNLLTFTGLKNLDPERSSNQPRSIPPLRMITFGSQIAL